MLEAVQACSIASIIPSGTEAARDDLQEDVRKSVTIQLVEDRDQVISIALEKRKAAKGKKKAVKSKPRPKARPSQSPASA